MRGRVEPIAGRSASDEVEAGAKKDDDAGTAACQIVAEACHGTVKTLSMVDIVKCVDGK